MTEQFHFFVEPLGSKRDRTTFSCGNATLDNYFRNHVGQDQAKGVAAAFLLIDADSNRIAGFYTLSAATIIVSDLPIDLGKKLPKYPNLPATLIGRLAIDLRYKGKKLGEYLLMDALRASFQAASRVGSVAVIVDAKDERSKQFYLKFGFVPLADLPLRLFIPMKTISTLF